MHEHHNLPHVEHSHPTAAKYIFIAVILTVLTIIEVAIYYVPAVRPFLIPLLIVLGLAKFVLVVGYYMHLKFDNKLFTWLFLGGLVAAVATLIGLWALQPLVHGGPGFGG
jgi:cytochrome c oxidase subunit 4